ncbi:MAG TPA: polyphenol oxidase family protein [Patescibacteria group bacterium]|nr:polyphenol oxidase family protein [Patescibacteria group bacterium]
MEWISRSGILLGTVPALGAVAPELRVWCTSRPGGTSPHPYDSLNLGSGTGDRPEHVRENRHRLLSVLAIPPERVARCVQVHGSRVAIVHGGGTRRETDGLITTARRLALAISTADCYPVAVYAPSEKVLAALHVGRSGAALGIIRTAIETMEDRYSIDTRGTLAVIGAGICRRCYTVYPETAARFPAKYIHRRNDAYYLDLLSHCTNQLLEGGLKRRNIFRADLCTSCNHELFYSHRRDHGRTGRHWMLAMIEPSP